MLLPILGRLFCVFLLCVAAMGQKISIPTQTTGNLPVNRFTPGVAGQCLTTDIGGNTAWGACAAGGSHNLLSATHGDTTAGTVARGDVIVGGSLPSWKRLPKGAANNVLKMDSSGVDVLWGSVDFSELTSIPQMAQSVLCTGTDKFSEYNASNGLFTCSADVSGSGSTPTGTGFRHVVAGVEDAASELVNLTASTDVAANQGTTTTVLHGNAAGQTTFAAVTSADTTGTFPATPHSVLSATHSDTTAATLVRGDGLFAVGPTPTLQRVAHGGTGTYFKWNGTDVVASTQAASGVGTVAVPCSNQFITSITTNADALPTTLCATVTRASEAADAKGWAFCGTATGAATTVGPVNAATCCSGGTCRDHMIHYIIKGYNGGTPVGRLLEGVGTPSTTALTNSASLREVSSASATDVATATVSIPGTPLAVTLTAIARDGWVHISGASGDFKSIRVIGMNGNPSVSAAPSIFDAAGWFSNLSTNLPLQQFQLTVYDNLTATSASSQAFLTGTALWVWGRNGD